MEIKVLKAAMFKRCQVIYDGITYKRVNQIGMRMVKTETTKAKIKWIVNAELQSMTGNSVTIALASKVELAPGVQISDLEIKIANKLED